jgi:glycosyltransferase involved in cell wall biosynthesis
MGAAAVMGRDSKLKDLIVLSSSCQMYSGTGTALFDWIRVGRRAIDFTILMDVQEAKNFEIAARCAEELGVKFLPSAPKPTPGCPDAGVLDVAPVIRSQQWDCIESVSWANAAIHLEILANRVPPTRLVFTPHTQPLWTLPAAHRFFMVAPAFEAMLRASDCVFLDSPIELKGVTEDHQLGGRVVFVPLGVNTTTFCYLPTEIKHAIFCAADFRERRKRPDLLLAAFAEARKRDPSLQLNLAGSGSKDLDIPASIQGGVVRLGYVSTQELVRAYQSAKAFVLLSDYEAFGLPIAEALCCGTPVIINRQPQLLGIFEGLAGVHFVTNSDLEEVKATLLRVVAQNQTRPEIARSAAARFNPEVTYGRKLAHLLQLCRDRPAEEAAVMSLAIRQTPTGDRWGDRETAGCAPTEFG